MLFEVRIKAVCIDMAGAYSAWVKEVLPDADIVYDHFHVIKMMNKRLDDLRRRTMSELCADPNDVNASHTA